MHETDTELMVVDSRGQKCPYPVLKAEKMLENMAPGERFVLLATDPVARIDVPLVCRKAGHGCTLSETGGVLRFEITKAL